MAKSIAHFQPTIDNFGQLTLGQVRTRAHAPLRFASLPQVHIGLGRNVIALLMFLLGVALLVGGLLVFDQTFFPTASITSHAVYGGVPVDYD